MRRVSCLLGLLVELLVGCGGSTPSAEDPSKQPGDDPEPGETRNGGGDGGFATSSRVGALDKDAVRASVGGLMGSVTRCVEAGRKQLPFLGGTVAVHLEVNRSGRASVAYVEQSTLGDHAVEACILDVFRSREWPRPVGGEVGEISQGFDFTAGHIEPPDDWTQAELEKRMSAEGQGAYDELIGKLRACRSESGTGRIEATMYLDEDGLVRAVGVAVADDKGNGAIDCVVTTLQTTSLPAPKSNFVKVTVAIQ